MTAPGWYQGEGDPPGTQRYWDGTQWIGEPVYEPSAPPVPPDPFGAPPLPGSYAYGAPVTVAALPTGLKVTAIVLSVLKAIPLVFALIGVVLLASISNEFDNEFDEFGLGLDGLLGAAIAVLLVVVLIGALLIGFQFAGAVSERPIMLFVPAVCMTVIDGFFALGAWSSYSDAQSSPFNDESIVGPFLMTAVLAAQAFVAVQAIRAKSP